MESLSRILKGALNGSDFNCHPMVGFNSHVFLLEPLEFLKMHSIVSKFQAFAKRSGLHANPAESCIYFGGVDQNVQGEILRVNGFSAGRSPFRYLRYHFLPEATELLKSTIEDTKLVL